MRVVAGTARSIRLNAPEGLATRPTTDRIKETLFNMLRNDIPGCRFLDLFAGSGGVGIEALSRGAAEAVFLEHDRRAAFCIRNNLEKTRLQERGRLITSDVFSGLLELETLGEPFDVIFMDPPYGQGWELRVLKRLSSSRLIHEDTLIIYEASLDTVWKKEDIPGFREIRVREYKTNKHVFLKAERNRDEV